MVDKRARHRRRGRSARAGFTLVEVMLAAIIATFVLGSVAVTMAQLARLKETSKLRLDAHLRAEAALNNMRRDVASIIRHDDLFWTRLVIKQGSVQSPIGEVLRDEILVFNTRLAAIQDLHFSGEGMQYETQYRIEETHLGAMLWQRRDAVPDENPLAGGIATPLVESIIAMKIEAYDGYEWVSQWDSDERGLPLAVRITVAASGARSAEDLYEGPIVELRTVVAIDRVIPPSDLFRPTEEELELMLEEVDNVSQAPTSPRGGRGGGRGGGGGGGRGAPADPGSPHGGPGQPGGAHPGRGGGGRGGGGGAWRQPSGSPRGGHS